MPAAVLLLVLLRTAAASAGWQRSLPDLSRQPRMAVFPAGPQPPALAGSIPHQTSTAGFGGQCSLPDAGPQLRASAGSVLCWTSTASSGWQCSPPDLNLCQKACQKRCQKACQKICRKQLQTLCNKSTLLRVIPTMTFQSFVLMP